MNNPLTIIGPILGLGAVYVLIPVAADTYRRFRGTKVVTCPNTHGDAAVKVDVAHAVRTSLAGPPELSVAACTRWPAQAGCDQACRTQLAHEGETAIA